MTVAYVAVGVSAYSAYQGKKAAGRAGDLDAQALAFAREQYEDWKEIYGPIEDALGEFYGNLTPDYIEAQGLQAQEKQYTAAKENMKEFFAVNEIESGAAADLFTKSELSNERSKAQIRADAPIKTAELKQGFLSLGLGQKASAQSSVTNALNTGATRAAGDADRGFDAAGDALSSAIDLYQYNNPRPTTTANQGTTKVNG